MIKSELVQGSPAHQSDKTKLSCAVITPVGPGHDVLVNEARASVDAAFRAKPGPFGSVLFMPMLDLEGKYGRSLRRNEGIDYALANGIDWIFFLDADDLMATDAFESVAPYLSDHDAVFGLIAEFGRDKQIVLRPNQLGATAAIMDILKNDPFLTLQMGHFVRTKAAAAIRFDESMDTGEDFKYYLQLWQQFRSVKIDRFLFVNRRGSSSIGPRSADGGRWRAAVNRVFEEFCSKYPFHASFAHRGKTVRFAIGNPMDLIHKHFMGGSFFEEAELAYLQSVIPFHSTILDIGANVGNHLIYFSMFCEPKKILPIEPNPLAIALLKSNIHLNKVENVDLSLLGFGVGETYGHFDLVVADNANIGAGRLKESSTGKIEVYALDDKLTTHVDFMKIDVEWMEIEVLRGAARSIAKYRPMIFIEIMNENTGAFEMWVSDNRYKIIKIFGYVNAKNYVVVPSDHLLAST